MKNITEDFKDMYLPKALLVFHNMQKEDFYVEALDIDECGTVASAHILGVDELLVFSKVLNMTKDTKKKFLQSEGLLPAKVLHIDTTQEAVIWYTPPMKKQLFFQKDLGIPSGIAYVPALVWKAKEKELRIFACTHTRKPNISTVLYHAPFFNLYRDGKVCMGTVQVESNKSSLEEFMEDWEKYFFNSYFSHLISNHRPIKGNIIQLWKNLIDTDKPFPNEILQESGITFQQLIDNV